MSLAEIEAAVERLTSGELEELESRLRRIRLLRRNGGQRMVSQDFSGSIRVEQDPLAWQRQIRAEWG